MHLEALLRGSNQIRGIAEGLKLAKAIYVRSRRSPAA